MTAVGSDVQKQPGRAARGGHQQVHHAEDISNADKLRRNAVLFRAVVIVAKCNANGRSLKPEFLICRRFARATTHQSALKLEFLVSRLQIRSDFAEKAHRL